jgi:hypothetical protein
MRKSGLVINEDNSHFFGTRSVDQMDMAHLLAFVDQYAGTQVSHLFLCPNSMRTSYRSKVWDPIWEIGSQKFDGPRGENWAKTAHALDEKGINPYTVWIARSREKGISPWITMRMNDIHSVHETCNFMHSTFWLKHPEYWRVPGSDWDWIGRAFDYGHKEVREHHMTLIREYLELFDIDGLELDWMRFGFHFKPGHEREGAEILTEFMREVREMTNLWSGRRGHPIRLGARVPARPMTAKGLGMDAVRWVREGLIDMLVPTPFFSSADTDIPLELWQDLFGPAGEKITLAAGLEILLRPYPAAEHRLNDLESVRGFAAAMLDRGADQIYLFNYMDYETTVENPADYQAIIRECARLETVLDKPRRHVLTYTDTWPLGVAAPTLLPSDIPDKGPAVFRIYTGPVPATGQAVIRVGLKDKPGVELAVITAQLNSEECTPLPDGANFPTGSQGEAIPNILTAQLESKVPSLFSETKRMIRFEIPLSALQRGYNLVQLYKKDGLPQQVVWMEIRIDPKG